MAATHPWHLGPVHSVTPEQVGWTYCGLRIVSLAAGAELELATGSEELAVVPLAGAASTVDVEGRHFDLVGRSSVFARVTDWCYLPIDAEVRLASRDGAVLALASARAQRRFDPAYVAAGDVRVELRGAGPSTRQVNNFMSPEAFDGADKLICRRGAHARRQLVELPAAQARRQPRVPGEQRGDLLLPRRADLRHRLRAGGLRHAPHVHAGRRSGRMGAGRDRRRRDRRRRVRDPPRLPRAVRGRARATRCTTST